MLFLIGAGAVNLHANPLPSCSDEWCHFTHPNWVYHVFRDGFVSSTDGSFAPEFHEWMSKNCPNWPELNALFKPLYLPRTIHRDYKNEVNALWEKNHPKDKGIIRSGEEKIREEQYLAAQKEKYGRNIPYCLTEKAQDRVQQERRETEKYLQHAKDVPMVRDRVVLLAKIEEANAKTAKEQGLEKFYKKPTPWAVDKATLDAWWAETHPNGKALDRQIIAQRYDDFFTKNGRIPYSLLLRHKNMLIDWWAENCSNGVKQHYFEYMDNIFRQHQKDNNILWLKHNKVTVRSYMDSLPRGVAQKKYFTEPVSPQKSQEFYEKRQKELYGQKIPYCLTQTARKMLQDKKQILQNDIDLLQKQTVPTNKQEIAQLTEELTVIQQALDSIPQMAEKLGLNLNRPLDPLQEDTTDGKSHLFLISIIVASIIAGTAIIFLRRKKNLPK